VVLNYSPSLFSEYRYKAEKIDIPNKNFLFNLKYFYKVEFKKLNKYWLIFLNDFFLDNKKNLRSFNEYGGLINENYWLDVKKNKRIELALDRAKLHEIKLDIMQKETMKMMEAIDLLRKKNHSVEICLITPPYSNEYINFLKQQKDYTTFLDYGAKLNTIKNLKYINFIDYYSNNQNFFADQEHLNSLGAINFSSILLKKCF
jgi:hypothetical protein